MVSRTTTVGLNLLCDSIDADRISGILMVATTNHLDELDPGLSKRPSRFDRKYLFPLPNQEERVLYGKITPDLTHSELMKYSTILAKEAQRQEKHRFPNQTLHPHRRNHRGLQLRIPQRSLRRNAARPRQERRRRKRRRGFRRGQEQRPLRQVRVLALLQGTGQDPARRYGIQPVCACGCGDAGECCCGV